jgi:hypothetical protein
MKKIQFWSALCLIPLLVAVATPCFAANNQIVKYDANGNPIGSAVYESGGNVFLPVNSRLVLWPDLSGPFISGTGTGLNLYGMGGVITLQNADTMIYGYGTTGCTVTGAGNTSANNALLVRNSANVPLIIARDDGKVGIGTMFPADTLDVNGNILSKGIKVVFNGNAFIQTGGAYAGFLAESGDGTSSTRFSFTDYTTKETAPLTWRVGMNGTKSFSIVNMTTGAQRVTLTEGGDFTVNGNILATGNIAAKYQDVAEWVPAATKMAAGTVVVLDPERPNEVMPSSQAYDTAVAGVVSAQPGLILGEAGEAKAKIATTGRVKVKVDATEAPVKIGDLLVTSERPGYAMKSQPLNINGRNFHQPGTVVGKALEPLDKGTGEILVLLSLQ